MAGDDYTAQAASIAGWLRGEAARLTSTAASAAELTAEASCGVGREGAVSVTATGEGRIREVIVDPRALRVPLPDLGDVAMRTVNQAMAAARDRAARSVPDMPAPGPDAERLARDLVGERVTGSSSDRRVTATGTGTGEIQSVRIEEADWREQDSRALGTGIAEAANAALEAAHRLRQRLLDPMRRGAEEPDAAIGEAVRQHARHMDELMDRLAVTERQIGDW